MGLLIQALLQSGLNQVIYTISGNCGDADTINITINESPEISSTYSDDSCMLSIGYIDLDITGGNTPYIYYWDNGDSTQNLTGLLSDTYVITVSDSNGCAKSNTIFIDDNLLNCIGDLWLPNIFSPNNDGLNDILYVRGAETASDFLFIIFNRWGEKIFESSDPNTGWDGTFSGEYMNNGVFAYIVTATFINGSEVSISGTVTLVK